MRTDGRPPRSYPACLTEHPLTDWDDAAGCFGNRDEHVRHHKTTCRMLPTQQRLEPDHRARLQFDDRLIVKVELLIGQSCGEVGLQGQSLDLGCSVTC